MGRPGRSCGDLVTDSAASDPAFPVDSASSSHAHTPGASHAAAQERMRHIPEQIEPDGPLPQGGAGDAYPVNEQHLENFNVGGVGRSLPPEQQLGQLVSYMESSYPVPDASDHDALDRYLAALPDRVTHAAMLMLGSGLDHTMPGVAYGIGVGIQELPEIGACLFTPSGTSEPSGRWAVSVHPGFGPRALELYWRPLLAAVAQLSGTTIVDVDNPDPDSVAGALDFISAQNPTETAKTTKTAKTAVLASAADEQARAAADQHTAEFVDAAPFLRPCGGYVSASIDADNEAGGRLGIIATPEEFRRIARETAQALSG